MTRLDVARKEKKRPSLALLALFGTLCSTLTYACSLKIGIPPGNVDAIASRSSGVAPLYVHFCVNYADSEEARHDFHQYEYIWDFDDPGSGAWGATGKSKNAAKGAIAAHVFETPGTYRTWLTVRDGGETVGTASFKIVVEDPDRYYSGSKTICVADTANSDFTGAPDGATCITTDTLSDITNLATAGRRTLTAGLSWPDSDGPVTIGAYGAGTGQDELGIYSNAPTITVGAKPFFDITDKHDLRIMDLHLVDSTRALAPFDGSSNMQHQLFLRLKVEGFLDSLGWSHWNNDSRLLPIDQVAVVSCDVSGGQTNAMFVGGERLAVLGNNIRNPHDSHVLRVWQAYKSVISDNLISGSSLDTTDGRHALKLHGPGPQSDLGTPVVGTGLLRNRTDFVIISDNVFGSSGPWPVAIGPQKSSYAEEITNVVFERNRICAAYGESSSIKVTVPLSLWCSYATVRNNILDGTGGGGDFTCIVIDRDGIEPPPKDVVVYNNTLYRADNSAWNSRTGISVGASATGVIIENNLLSFPSPAVPPVMVRDLSGTAQLGYNLLTPSAGFIDPDDTAPLSRDFRQRAGSPGIDEGAAVPVHDDFEDDARPNGRYDVGAFER
jgi:hypothetical protein